MRSAVSGRSGRSPSATTRHASVKLVQHRVEPAGGSLAPSRSGRGRASMAARLHVAVGPADQREHRVERCPRIEGLA